MIGFLLSSCSFNLAATSEADLVSRCWLGSPGFNSVTKTRSPIPQHVSVVRSLNVTMSNSTEPLSNGTIVAPPIQPLIRLHRYLESLPMEYSLFSTGSLGSTLYFGLSAPMKHQRQFSREQAATSQSQEGAERKRDWIKHFRLVSSVM